MKWIRDANAAVPPELKRTLKVISGGAEAMIEWNGRRLVNLASNNYLSLATHPEVIESAARALRDDGGGSGSSRLILGTSPRVSLLEESIAALKGAQRALVFPSGFAAAIGVIPSLVGKGDGIALEKGCHASLVTGARLSGASISVFRRGDLSTLEHALSRLSKRSLLAGKRPADYELAENQLAGNQIAGCRRILTIIDGIHSMDGDIAPLPQMLPILEAHESMLLLDDAHATGVLGADGSGTLQHFGLSLQNSPEGEYVIQMGTLSKALGSQGGFIAGSVAMIDHVIQSSASFIYTTGISPASVGAAQGAIEVMRSEPKRIARLERNALALRRAIGADPIPSPIVPVILGSADAALKASRKLEFMGAYAPAIRPPTVPRDTARLRLSVQADHRIHVEGAETTPEFSFLAALREIAKHTNEGST